jgi:hypothetical protein
MPPIAAYINRRAFLDRVPHLLSRGTQRILHETMRMTLQLA